jgi:putative membrane protein
MWVFMGLFWLALIAVIVWLVVQLLPARGGTTSAGPGAAAPPGESPLDILDRRLARGEVDLETYRAQRAALLESRGDQR